MVLFWFYIALQFTNFYTKVTMKHILRIPLLLLLLFFGACSQKTTEQETEKETDTNTSVAEEAPTIERFGGLTLYTLREPMAADAKGTLQKVSKIGYKYVEATDYTDGKFYGMAPEEFKNYVNSLGMELISSHQGGITLDNADQTIADVKAAGFKYLVVPVPPMGNFNFNRETMTMSMSDDVEGVTELLKTIGQKCKDAGIEMLYHNHDFEFKANANGVVPMDYFLENIDPEIGNFQLDLFWITKAGADPLAYFEKYPGRFKIWHVKDMTTEGMFAPVGQGTIDFGKILAQKDQAGMEYYIVEQDMTFDLAPLEAVKISFEGLKKFGFN